MKTRTNSISRCIRSILSIVIILTLFTTSVPVSTYAAVPPP
jgi:hypothetical protein